MTLRARSAKLAIVLALLRAALGAFFAVFGLNASLVLEKLALWQRLAVLRRATPRPRLRPVDRAFRVALSRGGSRWTDVLATVKLATVVAWHRRGFARFWAKKSRPGGRPPLAHEIALTHRPNGGRQSTFGSPQGRLGKTDARNALWAPFGAKEIDDVIVFDERHLLRLIQERAHCYDKDRPHRSLDGDAPVSRAVDPPSSGPIVAFPRVGAIHHRYSRAA